MEKLLAITHIVFLCAVLSVAGSVAAQPCSPTLAARFQNGPAVSSSVSAMLQFDDGSGPALFVAGNLGLFPGLTTPTHIAKYQRAVWTPLTGLPDAYARQLVVADFSSVNGPGRSLYAANDSTGVRRWNGSTWVATGAGNLVGRTYSLITWTDATGPMLLAAGEAPTIYAWRGTGSWTPYGAITNSSAIFGMCVIDDGSGTGPTPFAVGAGIWKYVSGTWQSFTAPPTVSGFRNITSFDDGSGPAIYLAGEDIFLPPHPSNGICAARLRNSQWEPLGFISSASLFVGPWWSKFNDGTGEQLYLCGPIYGLPGNGSQSLARWNGSGWDVPFHTWNGSDISYVHALARFDDGSGERTYFGGVLDTASYAATGTPTGFPVHGIGRIGPTTLEAMARGLGEPASGVTSSIYSLCAIDLPEGPRLIATGPFARAGGVYSVAAAAFDGTTWTPMSLDGFGTIRSPARFTIGGQTRVAGLNGNGGANVIYWDGAHWVPLSAQPTGTTVSLISFAGSLHALTSTGFSRWTGSAWQSVITMNGASCATVGNLGAGTRLFVSGHLPTTGAYPVYSYDGTTAVQVGANLPGAPIALAVCNGSLYVSGSGLPGNIARWDGASWTPLGSGLSSFAPALAAFDDGSGPALYVGGAFNNAGGIPAPGLARWRDGQWSALTPYVSGAPLATPMSMAVFNNKLYVAGTFTGIGAIAGDHLIVIEPCPPTCTADFDGDGDVGTDSDIDAFFACLAGNCCSSCGSADFNNDGDIGTDADIDSFFRVLAGGPC